MLTWYTWVYSVVGLAVGNQHANSAHISVSLQGGLLSDETVFSGISVSSMFHVVAILVYTIFPRGGSPNLPECGGRLSVSSQDIVRHGIRESDKEPENDADNNETHHSVLRTKSPTPSSKLIGK